METQQLDLLGPDFVSTREALHRVAEQLVAPARKPQNEIALEATQCGFGTPVFEFDGHQCQVRVEGAELVVRRGEEEKRAPITTLPAGAELIGNQLLPDGPPADTEALTLDPASAEQLGRWFGLGDAVLGELTAEWAGDDASDVNLWPEHFDIAIEAGPEAAGARANYGFSPGDAEHDEPYVYVGPWKEASGELWNAMGFNGAELCYSELASSPDPRAAALEFCRARKRALDGRGS